MNYEMVADCLTERLEGLQQENTLLRNELASALDEKYSLECKYVLICSDYEQLKRQQDSMSEVSGKDQFVELQRKMNSLEQELFFIQGSNFYKIWMRYRKLPESARKIIRQLFEPFKRVFRWIRGKN